MLVSFENLDKPSKLSVKPNYFEECLEMRLDVNPLCITTDNFLIWSQNVRNWVWYWRTQFIIVSTLKELVEKERRSKEVNDDRKV